MTCKLSCCHMPAEATVEEQLSKLVCKWFEKGRSAPRFVLVGWHTWTNLRRSLLGSCPEYHLTEDFKVATPVGMVTIAVDETRSDGMWCIPYAKSMRPL